MRLHADTLHRRETSDQDLWKDSSLGENFSDSVVLATLTGFSKDRPENGIG